MTSPDVKCTVKEIVANETVAMVQEMLDEDLCKSLYNMQSAVRSVVCCFVDQVMLDLLPGGVNGKMIVAHTAEYFNTYTAAERLLKRPFNYSSFMAFLATFGRRKSATTMENNRYSVANASKDVMDTVEPYNDPDESMQNCSKSGSEEPPVESGQNSA